MATSLYIVERIFCTLERLPKASDGETSLHALQALHALALLGLWNVLAIKLRTGILSLLENLNDMCTGFAVCAHVWSLSTVGSSSLSFSRTFCPGAKRLLRGHDLRTQSLLP